MLRLQILRPGDRHLQLKTDMQPANQKARTHQLDVRTSSERHKCNTTFTRSAHWMLLVTLLRRLTPTSAIAGPVDEDGHLLGLQVK